jgi:rhodanese-related sulfurtransferase
MKTILLTSLLLLFSSCVEPKEAKNKAQIVASMGEGVTKQFPKVKHISIEEIQRLKKSDYIFVDVRSPNEIKVSTIPGAITADDFEKNMSKYKDKKIITYCTIGYRSSKYADKFKDQGLDIYNMRESILGWAARKLPLDKAGVETREVHVYSDAWNFLPEGYTGVYK